MCNMLTVLAHGYATASLTPCQGGQMEVIASDWVDPAAWAQFDTWLYERAPFYQDNNYLAGQGTTEISQTEAETLDVWAKTVFEEIGATAAVLDNSEPLPAEISGPAQEPALFQISNAQGQWGLIDQSGQVIVEPHYAYIERFSEGRAAVLQDNLWGFLDENGQFVIEPQFTTAEGFWNGLARVEIEGKYGYIDHSGQFVWGPSPLAW